MKIGINRKEVKSFVIINIKKRNLNYPKILENIVIIQEILEELLIAFVIQIIKYPKMYPFIIKELAEEFKGELECLGEDTENILAFQCQLKMNMIMIKQLHTK